MLNITEEQKLDIAEAMAKHAGGAFYFLSDTIPAVKTSEEGKWHKVDSLGWWQVEDLFPFKIEDVPSKKFSLDGAGKIKDFRKMATVLRDELSKGPSDVAIEKRLASALIDSKITYLELKPLDEVIAGALKRSGNNPKAISEHLLEIQRTPIYWMENHGRSEFKSNESQISISEDGVSEVLDDPSDLVMAARYFINETAYCEKRFIKDFHELCGSRNLVPGVGVGSGGVGQLDSSVKSVLSAAYTLGVGGDEQNMIKALMSLTYKHEPLGVPKSRVPASEHIKNIKGMLARVGEKRPPQVENKREDTMSSSLKLIALISAREQMTNLYQALTNATSSSDSNTWVKITWSRLFSGKDISSWNENNVDDLNNRLAQAKNTYLPYLHAKTGSLKDDIGARISKAGITDNDTLDVLRDAWRKMSAMLNATERDPVKQFMVCHEINQVFSERTLEKLSGDEPSKEHRDGVTTSLVELGDKYFPKNDELDVPVVQPGLDNRTQEQTYTPRMH
ncbi:MAG: hypothetical protein CL840_04565 [Crocinitomicaceae bacterium]|nr:hypothetical protein [Crocinitomicaceae bacterium]|tara:strand:+ start:51659 stop:53176 length:1518 start_codon:yes stop_codon:yes gene_type:complete